MRLLWCRRGMFPHGFNEGECSLRIVQCCEPAGRGLKACEIPARSSAGRDPGGNRGARLRTFPSDLGMLLGASHAVPLLQLTCASSCFSSDHSHRQEMQAMK
jgi:hypothetical protein